MVPQACDRNKHMFLLIVTLVFLTSNSDCYFKLKEHRERHTISEYHPVCVLSKMKAEPEFSTDTDSTINLHVSQQ